jgi:hypothetical protein
MGWWHRVWHRWSKIGTHIWVPCLPETRTLEVEVYLLTNAGTRIQPREVTYTGRFDPRHHRVQFTADSGLWTLCEHEERSVVAIEAMVPLRQLGLGGGWGDPRAEGLPVSAAVSPVGAEPALAHRAAGHLD